MLLDLTDLEARNLHRRTGFQTARVGEVRRVRRSPREERQALELQRAHDEGGQDDGADQAEDDRVSFGERLHFGVHLPESCPASFTYTG